MIVAERKTKSEKGKQTREESWNIFTINLPILCETICPRYPCRDFIGTGVTAVVNPPTPKLVTESMFGGGKHVYFENLLRLMSPHLKELEMAWFTFQKISCHPSLYVVSATVKSIGYGVAGLFNTVY